MIWATLSSWKGTSASNRSVAAKMAFSVSLVPACPRGRSPARAAANRSATSVVLPRHRMQYAAITRRKTTGAHERARARVPEPATEPAGDVDERLQVDPRRDAALLERVDEILG